MPPPKQKPVTPSAVGPRFQPDGRCVQVFRHLHAIDFPEQGSALFIVAWVAADRGQTIRRKRHEVRQRETPGDVFDVRIEPAILVHDEDTGQLVVAGLRRAREIALDTAIAVR